MEVTKAERKVSDSFTSRAGDLAIAMFGDGDVGWMPPLQVSDLVSGAYLSDYDDPTLPGFTILAEKLGDLRGYMKKDIVFATAMYLSCFPEDEDERQNEENEKVRKFIANAIHTYYTRNFDSIVKSGDLYDWIVVLREIPWSWFLERRIYIELSKGFDRYTPIVDPTPQSSPSQ
jgi:hypothetical protein